MAYPAYSPEALGDGQDKNTTQAKSGRGFLPSGTLLSLVAEPPRFAMERSRDLSEELAQARDEFDNFLAAERSVSAMGFRRDLRMLMSQPMRQMHKSLAGTLENISEGYDDMTLGNDIYWRRSGQNQPEGLWLYMSDRIADTDVQISDGVSSAVFIPFADSDDYIARNGKIYQISNSTECAYSPADVMAYRRELRSLLQTLSYQMYSD